MKRKILRTAAYELLFSGNYNVNGRWWWMTIRWMCVSERNILEATPAIHSPSHQQIPSTRANILSAGKMSDSTFCWAKAHMRFTFHIAASNPGSLLTSGLCLTHDWMYEWKGGSIPNGLIMGNQQSEGDARFMMEYLRFCIIIRYFDKGNDYFDKRNHSTVYILSKMKLMNCSGYGPVQPNPTSL